MDRAIKIKLTEDELADIQSGETFHWMFNGIPVEVSLDDGEDD